MKRAFLIKILKCILHLTLLRKQIQEKPNLKMLLVGKSFTKSEKRFT